MDVFGVLALAGLGLTVVVMIGHRYSTMTREVWAVVSIALGVGFTWLADLDMWALWDIPVREHWIGVTLTGVALAGIAHFFNEILGFFAGLERKYNDEAETIEKTQGLRRVA